MIINHNIVALNTHRKLTSAAGEQSKAMEKLSSGLRINSAGDDAAGLAISEKMRSQIRGLAQASRNAQDGISMLQTAEGGASVIHEMLQRGRELAVQAANDTLTDEDRKSLNDELQQIKDQVSSTADGTDFNSIKLLNKGAVSSANASIINGIEERLAYWIDDSLTQINSSLGITTGFITPRDMKVEYYESPIGSAASMGTSDNGNSFTLRLNLTQIASVMDSTNVGWGQVDALIAHEVTHAVQFAKFDRIYDGAIPTWFVEGMATAVQGGNGFLSALPNKSDATIDSMNWNKDYGSAYAAVMTLHEITVGGLGAIIDELEAGNTLSGAIFRTTQNNSAELAAVDFADLNSFENWFNDTWSVGLNNYLNTSPDFTGNVGTIAQSRGKVRAITDMANVIANNNTIENPNQFNLILPQNQASNENIYIQVGANANQTIAISSFDISSEGLGISSMTLTTRLGASQTIEAFDSAILMVSQVRGNFGALQNRLEHALSNIVVSEENLAASESRIRNADIAKEMMNQTKKSILSQSAQAMLAQSNQLPQGILKLLR